MKARKKEISLKKEAQKAMRKIEVTVSFDGGSINGKKHGKN